MGLVSANEIVRDAYRHGYGVAAINCQGGNYDIMRAVIEAASEERAPVIVAIHPGNTGYYGLSWAPQAVRLLAQAVEVPVALHLDHGQDVGTVRTAIELGYTSVMLDYSTKSLDENVAGTSEVLEVARPQGITVEAELGELRRNPGDTETTPSAAENLVDPAHVEQFLSRAPVDMLAVGIGNAHGFYKGDPDIRLDLLEQVSRVAGETPLVLHGTTGIPEETVRKCIELGMAKINFGTIIRTASLEYLRGGLEGDCDYRGHLWRLLEHVKDRLKEDVRKLLRLTGSSGHAS